MINWSKAGVLLGGAVVAAVALQGCSKAPSQKAGTTSPASSSADSIPGGSASSLAAKLGEPPLPAPGRQDPAAFAMSQKYVQWVVDKAIPANVPAPPRADPNRSDPEAVAINLKRRLWDIGVERVAADAALKRQDEFLGVNKPAPKANYGHMADGLPAVPAGKN